MNSKSKRLIIFLVINSIFSFIIFYISIFSEITHSTPFYLSLLFLILSFPVCFTQSKTGAYFLIVISTLPFFLMYGLGGIYSLFSFENKNALEITSLITTGESAILLGISMIYIGYYVAATILKHHDKKMLIYDWPTQSIIIVGLITFIIGLVSTFIFYISFSINELDNRLVNSIELIFIVFGRMLGGLGEILLSYVSAKTKNSLIKYIVFILIALKIPLGIFLNAKSIAISFILTYGIVYFLCNRTIPFKFIFISMISIIFMFPLAYKYRAYMSLNGVSVKDTLNNLPRHLSRAYNKNTVMKDKKSLIERIRLGIKSITHRVDLKPNVELIVNNAGKSIQFQYGKTLAPLLFIFVPKFIYQDKPSVSVGRLFNREFGISADKDTYISTTFIGEMFWNYSWLGIIIGMFIIGITFGTYGAIFNLDSYNNISRILVILVVFYTLIYEFQTGIAQQYSLCLRTFTIVLVLCLVFSRRPKSVIS